MAGNAPRYVLDSFALLAYVQGEPGSHRIRKILEAAEKGQADVYLSIVNYAEAVYITEREKGIVAAQALIAVVDQWPLTVVDVNRKLAFSAAHWKAQYAIAYADAFAVALAQEKDAAILTGDPEFHEVGDAVQIEWLV